MDFGARSAGPLRISAPQLRTVVADLKPVVCGELTFHSGFWSLADMPGFCDEGRRRQLEFDRQFQQLHDALITFWRRLNTISQPTPQARYRLQVNLFEATLCVMALRLALRRGKLPDPASVIPNTPVTSRRRRQLLHRFTNLARKLKRHLEGAIGKEAADEMCKAFAERRNAIGNKLFHRVPKWAHARGLKKLFQVQLDEAVELAVEGLREVGVNSDKKEIRPLVRTFLHYCRRWRTGLTVPDLFRNRRVAKMRLAEFIQDHWAKAARRTKQENNRRNNETKFKVAPQPA